MVTTASGIASGLQAHAQQLDRFVGRLEQLQAERRLSQRDVTQAYSGALLSFYVRLESSIEQLFMGLLMGQLRVMGMRTQAKVVIRSSVVARDVLKAGRPFVAWLPYEHTKHRAETFLRGGRPFGLLTPAEIEALENARIIRNAIAHTGASAIDQFQRRFTAGRPLPPLQRTPAGYLRGLHAPGQSRFNYVMAECTHSVGQLCG